jgi:Protein of unknown function (DUF3108)
MVSRKPLILFWFTVSLLSACSTTPYLKYEKEAELRRMKEFEQQVVIKETIPVEEPPAVALEEPQNNGASPQKEGATAQLSVPPTLAKPKELKATDGKDQAVGASKNRKIKGKKDSKMPTAPEKAAVRPPDIEDSEGFNGLRRPPKDPFRVGEKLVHSVRYFSAEAGRLTFEVKPFVEVNGRKSYSFLIGLKTSSMFSRFYSVDDTVETFVDYETLVPHVFKLNIRETSKLVQAQAFFDHTSLKARFWERKYTEKSGEEEKKREWDLLPFSQNAFSGIFYMRVFSWTVGKVVQFRVSDDEKNVIFKGTALAREKISTEAGTFSAFKIKTDIMSRGALTPSGNIYIWISDDDRKLVLRIEAEIKIGRLVSEVVDVQLDHED